MKLFNWQFFLLSSFIGCAFFGLFGIVPVETSDLFSFSSGAVGANVKPSAAAFSVADSLEMKLFASEPTLTNPTNIDIDQKGRVWVCEAFNYRPGTTGNATRPSGDRILILEDKDGDGVADTSKVFYEGKDLQAPLGICLLENSVIVSQAPNVWRLTDVDGDDKADKKELVLTGIGGEQHDHGLHSFSLGPDGKLYFTMGNEGRQILDRNGNPLKDKTGTIINFSQYRQGLLLRCDTDFTDMEVLGQNFRNNYEAAVDSYGTVWQSDNDDDGNKSVRINYVMEHGNFGYTDEMTGAGWRINRTNLEDSLQRRHWHQNDPGVVPDLLHTGAGSPTGMAIYEGNLLPAIFRNQIVHCDAGQNVVRAYPVVADGAGFKAHIVNIVKEEKDQWFRPTDVCVAPDGSLFVSDWYDPVVGGHQMGDTDKGRIYRIAPKRKLYHTPVQDLNSIAGSIRALHNPNLLTRFMAQKFLIKQGQLSVSALQQLINDKAAPSRVRALGIWTLSRISGIRLGVWKTLFNNPDPNLRITVLRAIRQSNMDPLPYIEKASKDPDPQLRREAALALYGLRAENADKIWATLAIQHHGEDRWYLEALGIGAKGQWDSFFKTWAVRVTPHFMDTKPGKDIIWRARTPLVLDMLTRLALDDRMKLSDRLRYFRALDFNPDQAAKDKMIVRTLESEPGLNDEIGSILLHHVTPALVVQSGQARSYLQKQLDRLYGTQAHLDLVAQYDLRSENDRLLRLLIDSSAVKLGRPAAQLLLSQGGGSLLWERIHSGDERRTLALLSSLKGVRSTELLNLLDKLIFDKNQSETVRLVALKTMSSSGPGEDIILKYLKDEVLTGEFKGEAIKSLKNAWRKKVRMEAESYAANQTTATAAKRLTINELVGMTGDINAGKVVFSQYCTVCHSIGKEGVDFGPGLSSIGAKLPKEGLYLAILNPSSGVSFGYETSELTLKDGSVITGIISSRTESQISIKFPGGVNQEYKTKEIKAIKNMETSLMPAGFQEDMSTKELVDLVEFMQSLK